jgi:hypothetical protein
MFRELSIDRISLQRLLNRPEDELTTTQLEYVFSRVQEMELELLLSIIAVHPALSRDPRVIDALAGRAGAMSRRELGISLRRCPRLVAADRVMTAFHAQLEAEVESGLSLRSLAEEFAERLGANIYQALVERAFPDSQRWSEAALEFGIVLSLIQASRAASTAAADQRPAPVDDAALRAVKDREDTERERGQAFRAELKARAYQELPKRDEVAALAAPARSAWNEKFREGLAQRNTGALYYLRYPLRDELFDAETLAQLRGLIHCERLDAIIDTEDLRSMITREQVEQQVVERQRELIWIERAPEWLDAALIERLRHTLRESRSWDSRHRKQYEMELSELVPRCLLSGKEAQRRQLLEVLVEHARAGNAPDAFYMTAELLAGNSTLWKSKHHGQALVLAALQQRCFASLRRLIFGGPPIRFRCLEEVEEALKPQVKAMNYAFGCALLTWAREQMLTGDTGGVERALAALGLLDPPRYFADDLHRFKRETPLPDNARHLTDHIHRIAKSNGGADAQVYALFQCIDELQRHDQGGMSMAG